MNGSERNLQKPIQGCEYRKFKEAMCLLDSEAIAEKDREGKADLPRATSMWLTKCDIFPPHIYTNVLKKH